MPPKKGKGGGKKKGTKKGGKGGKKKGLKKKETLTAQEKFLQFQISSQTDAKVALQQKKTALQESSKELQKKLDGLSMECVRVLKVIRAQVKEVEYEILDAEESSTKVLHEALQAKMKYFQEQEAEVHDLRNMRTSMKEELEEIDTRVKFLEHYRDVEQGQLARQIHALQLQLEQEEEDFEENARAVQERFERTKYAVIGQLQEKLSTTREAVTDYALRRQSIQDKVGCE